MVQNAEGTAEEYTTNNVDMDRDVGLPSNTDEGTLSENLSDRTNEESLKVMREQKKIINPTERLKSKVRNTMRVIHLLKIWVGGLGLLGEIGDIVKGVVLSR